MKRVPPNAAGYAEALSILRAGGIVAHPTETVYGLAVDPFNPEAVARLFQAKGRAESNPVLLIIADPEDARRVARAIGANARRLIDAFWPGPLSLALPKTPDLPAALTAGGDTVSLRCTASPEARALCQVFGGPLTSSSANRSGQPPATAPDEIDLDGVALVIDAGALAPSPPSTVYDPDSGTLFREGAITGAMIRRVLDA